MFENKIPKEYLKNYIMDYIKHETGCLNMARNKNYGYMQLYQIGKIRGVLAILDEYGLIDYEERLEINKIINP